jgi:hypothetical protein
MINRTWRLLIILVGVCLVIVAGGNRLLSLAISPATAKIVVNQVGYLSDRPKVAFLVNSDSNQQPVELIDRLSQKTVQVLRPSAPQPDAESKDLLQTIDFSHIKHSGQYFLRAGKLQSHPFEIAPNVYQESLIKRDNWQSLESLRINTRSLPRSTVDDSREWHWHPRLVR